MFIPPYFNIGMDSPTMFLILLSIFYFRLIFTVFCECDIGGTWSTWKMEPIQDGYDFCGSFWQVKYYRRCLSEPECPCTGQDKYTSEIFNNLCTLLAGTSCSPNYTVITSGNGSYCGPLSLIPQDPTPEPGYCPPSGVGIWGSWSGWDGCTASCGGFGIMKRTRTCISESYGCPCYGSDVGPCQIMSCPGHSCPSGPPCAYESATRYNNNATVCYPFGITTYPGSWTEWAPAAGKTCSDTCGMYGAIQSERYCLPSGSRCPGDQYYYLNRPCPPNPCVNEDRPPCNQTMTAENGGKCVITKSLGID